MEAEHLQQVRQLIDRIADCYHLPTDEQVSQMRQLTGQAWTAQELQELCGEYWSHHSLEETAYFMFHREYPPVQEVELVFWNYKNGVRLDDETVYATYRFGKKPLKALEDLPLGEILENISLLFPQWKRKGLDDGDGADDEFEEEEDLDGYDVPDDELYSRFDSLIQENDWTDTHFEIFEYGRDVEGRREHQMLVFHCRNLSEEQINAIVTGMEGFHCPLHIPKKGDS